MEDLISINEEGLDRVVLDVYDHLEKINSILNQVNDLVLESKSYFSGPINDELTKIYSEIKVNIDNFKSNVSTYSTDLIKVKNKFKQKDDDLSDEVRKHSAKIQSMEK